MGAPCCHPEVEVPLRGQRKTTSNVTTRQGPLPPSFPSTTNHTKGLPRALNAGPWRSGDVGVGGGSQVGHTNFTPAALASSVTSKERATAMAIRGNTARVQEAQRCRDPPTLPPCRPPDNCQAGKRWEGASLSRNSAKTSSSCSLAPYPHTSPRVAPSLILREGTDR